MVSAKRASRAWNAIIPEMQIGRYDTHGKCAMCNENLTDIEPSFLILNPSDLNLSKIKVFCSKRCMRLWIQDVKLKPRPSFNVVYDRWSDKSPIRFFRNRKPCAVIVPVDSFKFLFFDSREMLKAFF